MKVGKFPDQFVIHIPGGSALLFGTATKLATWAEGQLTEWSKVKRGAAPWKNYLGDQEHHFQALRDIAERYRQEAAAMEDDASIMNRYQAMKNEASGIVNAIQDGRTLTTDTPRFSQILSLSANSPDAATLLYLSQRSDATSQMHVARQQGHHFDLALIALASSNDSEIINPKIHANEIQSLKAELRRDSENYNDDLKAWNEQHAKFAEAIGVEREERTTAWKEQLSKVEDDWKTLKKVYDEDLALEAPTHYWKDRETRSRWMAIGFGAAFLVAIGAALAIFVHWGLPYLHGIAGNTSINVLVAALPILVPGFIAVWILRILGRLFAENFQLSVDAGERQTMVKTFLALMHDEQRGKALVTDDDRILILHALFRPSAVSSADDAPPVHWFDILSKKLGGPSKP